MIARRAGKVNVVALIGLGFTMIGVVAVGIAVWLLYSTHQFKATARPAEGVVTRLEWSSSRDSNGRESSTAHPWVRFQSEGRTVEFRGGAGTSPPAYREGDKVRVLYQPGQPQEARIDGFWEAFVGPIIAGGIGTVFTVIGLGCLVVPALGTRKRRRARELGIPVKAKVIEVGRNHSVTINGRSPWVLVAEFQDPATGKSCAFTSHNLWVNPEPHYPVGSEVTVFYLPEKPSVNAFQIENLPEIV
jgi:Protein of unknown function (DUF3592)